MQIQEYGEILTQTPVSSRKDLESLAPGASITWNLLVGTSAPVPFTDDIGGKGEYLYTLEDLVEMRDNFYRELLGVKPSVYIGHELRYSGSPAMGTVMNLAIVENGMDFELWFQSLWVPEGKYKIDTQEFKYVSLESNNKQNGSWVLTAIALTNTPAYPMMEVRASSKTGGTMEDFMRFIDPKKYLEYLKEDEEGKRVLVEFYKSYSEDFVEQETETPPDEEVKETTEEVSVEGAETEEVVETTEEKKEVVASSTVEQFEKELAVLAPMGNKWTSAQQKEALKQSMHLAYAKGPMEAVKNAVSLLMGRDSSKLPAPSGAEVSASSSRNTISPFEKQAREFSNSGGK